jgi:hypothetical protein
VLGSTPPRKTPALLARLFVGAGANILPGGRRAIRAKLNQAEHAFVHPAPDGAPRAYTARWPAQLGTCVRRGVLLKLCTVTTRPRRSG